MVGEGEGGTSLLESGLLGMGRENPFEEEARRGSLQDRRQEGDGEEEDEAENDLGLEETRPLDSRHLDENEMANEGKKGRKKNSKLGFFFIGVIVVIWVASSFLVQSLESKLEVPFFLTFVGTSMFTTLLPVSFLTGSLQRIIDNDAAVAHGIGDPTLVSLRNIFRGACIICPFWFIANFLYNLGLHYTSVTSSTILSGTSVVFTLALGNLFGLEGVSFRKVLGVAACMWGTAMVGLQDNKHTAHSSSSSQAPLDSTNTGSTIAGDVATLFGAFFYACYTLLIEKLFPGGDASADMAVLFGFIGLVNTFFLLPVVMLFHFTGVESLHPLTGSIFLGLLLNGLFNNVLSDYLFARAVLLTTPTITSVGLAMTIPLATVVEALVHVKFPPLLTLSGAVLVTAGFIAASLSKDKVA